MPNMGGAKSAPSKSGGPAANMLNLPVNSTETIKVLKLESNGNARLEIDSTGTAAMPTGQPAGTPTMTTLNVTATPLGVLTGAKSAGPAGAGRSA